MNVARRLLASLPFAFWAAAAGAAELRRRPPSPILPSGPAPTPTVVRNVRFEVHAWRRDPDGSPRLWGSEAFLSVEGIPAAAKFGAARGHVRSVTVERGTDGSDRTRPIVGFADAGVAVALAARTGADGRATLTYETVVTSLVRFDTIVALEGRVVELPILSSQRSGGVVVLRDGEEHRIDLGAAAGDAWFVVRVIAA